MAMALSEGSAGGRATLEGAGLEQGETGGEEVLHLLGGKAAAGHAGQHGEAPERLEPLVGERIGQLEAEPALEEAVEPPGRASKSP